MARPKRRYSGETTVTAARHPYGIDDTGEVLGTRRRARWERGRNLAYPLPIGTQCPLTAFHVLDALLAIDEQVELRALELCAFLNANRPGLVWEPITLGKHLADLRDAFAGVLGDRNGLLQGGRDYKGNFYHLNRTPETVALARNVLDDLLRLVQDEIASRRRGRKTDFMGSVLVECKSLRGEWRDLEDGE